jgi:cell division protein ZapA
MAEVAITVNGRSYRFACGDGEEARLKELAAYVKSRMDGIKREHSGSISDDRLLLMTALLIADDLWDATAGDSSAPAKTDAA